MNALIGIANKPQGYSWADVEFLRPLIASVGQLVHARRLEQHSRRIQQEINQLSEVVQKTTNQVVITDIQGKIVWVNQPFEQLTGYQLAEIQGRKPGSFLQGALTDQATVAVMREAQHQGRSFKVDVINYTKAGEPYWVRIQCDPLLDSAAALSGFIAIESDITDEKKQLEQIQRNERRLTAVLEATNIATWEWNVQTGETTFNERWAEIIGYQLNELAPVSIDTWLRLVHPADAELSRIALEQHFRGETTFYDVVCRMLHRDGHWVWVHDRGQVKTRTADGQPLLMYGTHADISQQQFIQQQLQQSKDDFESLLGNMPAVSYRQSNAGNFVFLSPQIEQLTGYAAEAFINGSVKLDALIHPADRSGYQLILNNSEYQHWNIEYRLQCQNSEWIWVSDRGQHRYNADGQWLYKDGFLLDISQEIQAQQTVLRQMGMLEVLSSIAALNITDLQQHVDTALAMAVRQLDASGAHLLLELGENWKSRYSCGAVELGDVLAVPPQLQMQLQSGDVVCSSSQEQLPWLASHAWRWIACIRLEWAGQQGVLMFCYQQPCGSEPEPAVRMFIRLFARWLSATLERAVQSEHLHKLTAQIPGMVYQFQMWPDGRSAFPYSSPGIRDIYQVSPQEVQHDAAVVFSRLEPADLPRIEQSITVSRDELSVWHCQYRTRLSDGKVRWLEGNALPEQLEDGSVLWHGYIHDISQAKQIELELASNESRLRSLFELSPVGIALNDLQTGRYLSINQALVAPTGYSVDEFLALSYWQLTPRDYEAQELQQLRALQETGRYGPYEKEYIRADGSRYPVLLSGVLIEDVSGRQLIWSIVEDISVRKEQERALRHAKALAESTAAMKSMFLANMSHEIRTPLNGVLGMLDILSRSALSDTQQYQLQVAMKSGQSLMGIINDILDFSKIEAGKLQFELRPFNLLTAVDDVVSMFRPQAIEKQISLQVEYQQIDLQQVIGDEIRFKQILSNLLSNAIKFTKNGGVRVLLGCTVDGNAAHCHLVVIDTGIGISAAQQKNLFSAFSQADSSTTRRFGGTGLGLAITRELCRLMDGDIQLDSEINRGTRFDVQLPFVRAEAVALNTEETPACFSLQGRQVLLVEDNPVNTLIASTMLQEAGITVRHAENGLIALEVLRLELAQGQPQTELVLMDCLMPELDGFAATAAIREGKAGLHWQQIPVIALTANAITEERDKCLRCGMNDFLAKPVKAKQLIAMLAQHLNKDKSNLQPVVPIQSEDTTNNEAESWSVTALQQNLGAMAVFIPELLAVFVAQADKLIEELPDLFRRQDLTSIRLKTHSLKGSAGQLLFKTLAERAMQVEYCCQQGALAQTDLAVLLQCLQATIDLIKVELADTTLPPASEQP
jgi:PAS domain S-box-containing protein